MSKRARALQGTKILFLKKIHLPWGPMQKQQFENYLDEGALKFCLKAPRLYMKEIHLLILKWLWTGRACWDFSRDRGAGFCTVLLSYWHLSTCTVTAFSCYSAKLEGEHPSLCSSTSPLKLADTHIPHRGQSLIIWLWLPSQWKEGSNKDQSGNMD